MTRDAMPRSPNEVKVTLNGHVQNEIFRGLSIESAALADKEGIAQQVEDRTGYSFGNYFTDRLGGQALYEALYEWVDRSYPTIVANSNHADSSDQWNLFTETFPREQLTAVLARAVERHVLNETFGKAVMIRAQNRLLKSQELKDEFYATTGEVSSRDFSFLLDGSNRQMPGAS